MAAAAPPEKPLYLYLPHPQTQGHLISRTGRQEQTPAWQPPHPHASSSSQKPTPTAKQGGFVPTPQAPRPGLSPHRELCKWRPAGAAGWKPPNRLHPCMPRKPQACPGCGWRGEKESWRGNLQGGWLRRWPARRRRREGVLQSHRHVTTLSSIT